MKKECTGHRPVSLFIVDVQAGFLNRTTRHIVSGIDTLISERLFDWVFCSRFRNSPASPFTRFLKWYGVTSNEEQQMPPCIREACDACFDKDSYSAVTDEVVHYLRARAIERVALVGLDTDGCVLATALDLFSRGIEPILIEDCCSSTGGQAYHEMALHLLSRTIGSERILTSKVARTLFARQCVGLGGEQSIPE